MSRLLLERCVDAAAQRGVSGNYSPWLPVDLLQTLLVDVHEALGCSWLSAIAASKTFPILSKAN